MRVLIVGANGKIGRHLLELMAESPHEARAMVRDADQIPLMEKLGATEAVVADLEGDCGEALRSCDAVVFTAGSGPHTGPDKTVDVDQNGAMRIVDAAAAAGIRRFVMVSAMRADEPDKGPEKIRHYLLAKQKADDHLRASGMDYTVVRPGPLTEDPATGRIEVGDKLERTGKIPREDVAAVLLATLDAANTENRTFDVLSGEIPVAEAVAGL
ncbi:SDR family oxidoreductase [Marinobacter sp. JSM 1782161]|uniref:SDR family oxidoreductase n=1 Tax=Marinobacter sp. JSM 1782161 TaxID=2685906 RepID=UPI0014022BE6|nr:SDR family oxidoreductase [Marinobacter sp. JSM 1782161]